MDRLALQTNRSPADGAPLTGTSAEQPRRVVALQLRLLPTLNIPH